jgi:hypothetical protein
VVDERAVEADHLTVALHSKRADLEDGLAGGRNNRCVRSDGVENHELAADLADGAQGCLRVAIFQMILLKQDGEAAEPLRGDNGVRTGELEALGSSRRSIVAKA